MIKSREMILLFAVVTLAVAIQENEQCGKNEEFTTCGTACPSKCSDGDALKRCTDQCIVGCQCKPGFMLNCNNECVTPEEC